MPTQDSPNSYGSVSRLNHWIGALLVLALLGIGLYFDSLPRGDERSFWRSLHVSIGALAALFLLWRVWWRARSTSPLALPQAPAAQTLSKVVHGLLLAGIVVMAVSGPLIVWSAGRGIPVFALFTIPSPMAGSEALHEALEEVHGFTADALLILVGLHLLGVLKHQFIDRDNIMARMTGRAPKA